MIMIELLYAYVFGIITYMLYHEWQKRRNWKYRWDHISTGINGLLRELEELSKQVKKDENVS